MWIRLFNAFTKITAWPLQKLIFRTRILYEDKSVQSRRIRGAAMLISNHTSVFDYAIWLFVFWSRTLRVQMAEVLFRRKLLGLFLRQMGGIYVDRDGRDLSFVAKSVDILNAGGVVGIFPEGRLPRPGEERPLPFKTSAAYIALQTGCPIIPVYTDGSYFCRKRASVIIGTPILPEEAVGQTDEEKIVSLTGIFRARIVKLGEELHESLGDQYQKSE